MNDVQIYNKLLEWGHPDLFVQTIFYMERLNYCFTKAFFNAYKDKKYIREYSPHPPRGEGHIRSS